MQDKKYILFVCGGNTCRSPMAKAILEQKLKAEGLLDRFNIDSAAYDYPTHPKASNNAREAIKQLTGEDLLANHESKKLTPVLIEQANLILVMGTRMKEGLPEEKTYTLREYAGKSGNIADPFSRSLAIYLMCAQEISTMLELIIDNL